MSAKSTNRTVKTTTAKAEKASAPKAPSTVIFRSTRQENHEITIMGIRGLQGAGMKLTFEVPADKADRFAEHHHVMTGRVTRVG